MRWPGNIPEGTVCDELAFTMDLLPTIAALVGVKVPTDRIIDGKDIRPLMFAAPGAVTPHEVFYYYGGRALSGIRSGKWKLMFPQQYAVPSPSGKDGIHGERSFEEMELSLYNLDLDVGERRNLVHQYPEVVKELESLAEQARADLGDGTDRLGANRRPVGRL